MTPASRSALQSRRRSSSFGRTAMAASRPPPRRAVMTMASRANSGLPSHPMRATSIEHSLGVMSGCGPPRMARPDPPAMSTAIRSSCTTSSTPATPPRIVVHCTALDGPNCLRTRACTRSRYSGVLADSATAPGWSTGAIESAGRGVAHRHQDALQLAERGQPLRAVLAADPGALEAAERRAHVEGVPVDAVGAGADLFGDLVAVIDVRRPHRSGEAVVAVVGDLDRLLLGVVGDHRQDRAEDLLLRDRHLGLHVGEYG